MQENNWLAIPLVDVMHLMPRRSREVVALKWKHRLRYPIRACKRRGLLQLNLPIVLSTVINARNQSEPDDSE